MEVRVRERLVGALVLVAIVVLLVPAVLKGRGPAPAEPPGQPTRRVEVPLGGAEPAPEEQILVPEPAPETPAPIAKAAPPKPTPKESATGVSPPEAQVPKSTDRKTLVKPPAPKTPAAVATAEAPAWAVQLGAFSNRAKAEQLVADLRKRQYSAFVLEYRAAGQVLYRVRVGPEQDRARAEEIAARLAKDGFQTVVARHP